MLDRRRFVRTSAAVALSAFAAGCSRAERVQVVNRFAEPVRIRLGGRDTSPLVPANGEAFLDDKHYLGGNGVRVTVLSAEGRTLKAEHVVDIPGDTAYRRVAVLEVQP